MNVYNTRGLMTVFNMKVYTTRVISDVNYCLPNDWVEQCMNLADWQMFTLITFVAGPMIVIITAFLTLRHRRRRRCSHIIVASDILTMTR